MVIKLFCRPSILDRDDAEGAIVVSSIATVLWVIAIWGSIATNFTTIFPFGLFGGLGALMTWMALWLWGVHMNPFGWKDCDE